MAASSVGSYAPTSVYSTALGISVPSGTDCLLLFVHQIVGTPDATATLGSQSFNTALDTSSFAYGNRVCRLLRLDNPTSGSGTVSLTGSTIRGYCLLAVDGVDLTNLFQTLSSTTYTDTSDDTFSVTASSSTNNLAFLFAGVGGSGGTTLATPQFSASDGSTLDISMYEDGVGVAALEEAGAASVTLGVNPNNSGGTNQLHVGLIYGSLTASGGAPTVTDYTMVYRRAQMAAIMGD